MEFINHTPFPGIAWVNGDKDNHTYVTIVVRVKYLFDLSDTEGHWSLKLAPEQEALFAKDMYYDEEDIASSSVRFESDFVPYKPHGDLIVNAYAHSKEPQTSWRCGVEVLRPSDEHFEADVPLLQHWLRVHGEREIQDDVIGYSFTRSKEATRVPIRYEYANGGVVDNPEYEDTETNDQAQYLIYSANNPIGVGVAHKALLEEERKLPAPQIEALGEPIEQPNMPNLPQGFGFYGRAWQPRIGYAGTYDTEWIKNKFPVYPDDFDERHNNAAHPQMQLTGYFKPHDKIVLYHLSQEKSKFSFALPEFHFKAQLDDVFMSDEVFMDIDTVVVDVLEDAMQDNAVYVSYRTRIPSSKEVNQSSISMLVPEDFIGGRHG